MNGYLLDTNILIWALGTPEHLSPSLRAAIERGPVWLSVISYWEVVVRSMKGKLHLPDPQAWWTEGMEEFAAHALSLRVEHVSRISALPSLHRDPFDRALIAQALAEDLTLLSADRTVAAYASAGLRVLA